MKKAVLSNRIYLTRTKELHQELIDELTYRLPPKKPGNPYEIECDVTRVNKDILTIPSGRLDLIPNDYEIVDKRIQNPVNFTKFKFTLRESQQEVYDLVDDSCMIIANPSWGKTFMGIAIATKLKQKTLIIVHTKFLMEQWIDEVEKTTGLKAGIVGAGKFDIKSPIVVALFQTLRNKGSQINKEFGLIIVDEAHHCPAKVFKSILDKFNARYKIGLTATPWRKDGRHVMLEDYFSKTEYKPKDENELTPKIVIVNSGIKFDSSSMTPWANKITKLVNDMSYVELVLNLAHAQAKRGFKVLVVSDRTEFLETCADVLDNSMCIIGRTDNRDFLGSNKDICFGSIKIFAEGINMPPLSCLILATPTNNKGLLKQLIGRITRPYEGKNQPEVIDIALEGTTGKNQVAQRLNYYIENGYKVRYI